METDHGLWSLRMNPAMLQNFVLIWHSHIIYGEDCDTFSLTRDVIHRASWWCEPLYTCYWLAALVLKNGYQKYMFILSISLPLPNPHISATRKTKFSDDSWGGTIKSVSQGYFLVSARSIQRNSNAWQTRLWLKHHAYRHVIAKKTGAQSLLLAHCERPCRYTFCNT